MLALPPGALHHQPGPARVVARLLPRLPHAKLPAGL